MQEPPVELPVAAQGLSVTADCCARLLALPRHPYQAGEARDLIIAEVLKAVLKEPAKPEYVVDGINRPIGVVRRYQL